MCFHWAKAFPLSFSHLFKSKIIMFRDRTRDSQPTDESAERLLAEEEGTLWTKNEETPTACCKSFATGLLQTAALVLFFLIGTLFGFDWRGDLDTMCHAHTSQYSTITREVGIEYSPQMFNGSLLKENTFRLDAGPEVDAAWESLGINYRSIRVPFEDAKHSGLAADQVKINKKYGGGFPANVEGLHHLHCLVRISLLSSSLLAPTKLLKNLLRQSLYYNYDYYHAKVEGPFVNDDYIVRRHVSHCLDIIRQELMCTVDTGVLGQIWIYPESPEPYVDFNTVHRCKNFEDVRGWAEKSQLPVDPPSDFLEPPVEGDRIYDEMP
ncbi:unnamed protein product [Penicillium salamii]|nr:unnamed protein product [Penicillium salamii]CAG8274179.1 unnamed protein product [Penicillium salamii]